LHLEILERIHRGERTLARYEEGRNYAQKGCSKKAAKKAAKKAIKRRASKKR
jgi:hypothetical protein